MMVIGETLVAGSGGTTVCSPWFEACGNAATFVVEVLRFLPGTNQGRLRIVVRTKNSEDTDPGTVIERTDFAGQWDIVRVGVNSARYEGFLELVRFEYQLTVVAPNASCSAHLRMLPPIWESNCIDGDIEAFLEKEARGSF